jgi:hypothetical protein
MGPQSPYSYDYFEKLEVPLNRFSFVVFERFESEAELQALAEDTGANDTNIKVRTAWQHSALMNRNIDAIIFFPICCIRQLQVYVVLKLQNC